MAHATLTVAIKSFLSGDIRKLEENKMNITYAYFCKIKNKNYLQAK